jgi:riboflavin kinase/FMN adenylyltransferase|tara:strand:+ start:753 stop:1685 length:933 start_codon:yes stop_codon:yes gene_type:complete
MVKIIKLYNNFKIKNQHKNSIILIGNFDGLHTGHQKLFNIAKNYKKKYSLKIGVLTFEPMPKMYFNDNLKNFRISSQQQKINYLNKLNVDFVITKKFDKKFSKTKSITFIKEIIGKKINPRFIFVSNNFKFGNKREGNVRELIKYEKQYNYKIVKPQPSLVKKKVISSSLIRKYLQNGKLKDANKLLKRNWSIIGKVQKGKQLGKKIGFPTANIDIKDYILAKPGVYVVKVQKLNSLNYIRGIANLGYRPTFNGKKVLLEIHLFNFSGNLYNKYLTVEFLKFIRSEKKFKNVDQLKKQIKIDLLIAKKTK